MLTYCALINRVAFKGRVVALRWDLTELVMVMVVKETIGHKTKSSGWCRKNPKPKHPSHTLRNLNFKWKYSFYVHWKSPPLSFLVARPSKDKDIFDFKLFAKLDAFCLSICDEKKNIAEIKIQGIEFLVSNN